MIDPGYQQWWQQFLQQRQAAYQQQIQALHQLQPWHYGFAQPMPNALLSPSAAGNARLLDPGTTLGAVDQQQMMPYFLGATR